MRLDAWLKQPHTQGERLRLVERLAQALNAVHDRGETLVSIAPERVEIGNDQKVDLAPAARGKLEPGYAAPERLEGEPPSTAADVYAVGALCWEILVGRPCGEAPRPLAEVAPELPRELANSVMGCLEKGPEWRPKDLTYLAQLAAAQQKVGRPEKTQAPSERAAPQARAGSATRSSSATRAAARRPSRSLLPLFLAAILLIAAAASSYLWLHREQGSGAAPAVSRPRTPVAAASAELPSPSPEPTTSPTPVATPKETPTPVATPVARAASLTVPQPAATPVPTPPPTPEPTPAATPTPEAQPAVAAPEEPATLSALSPLSVKRPGRVLIDLRGAGLRSDLQVRVLQVKETPRGITVVRQRWTSPTLLSALLELDGTVAPGVYAIALEDASGTRTNTLQLHITK
jgi:hypothetical protein